MGECARLWEDGKNSSQFDASHFVMIDQKPAASILVIYVVYWYVTSATSEI